VSALADEPGGTRKETWAFSALVDGKTVEVPGWALVLACALRNIKWAVQEVETVRFKVAVLQHRERVARAEQEALARQHVEATAKVEKIQREIAELLSGEPQPGDDLKQLDTVKGDLDAE
jgi:hypothetical protein